MSHLLSADANAHEGTRSVVFVSDRVDDLTSLLATLPADTPVVRLDSSLDGLSQMAVALAACTGLDAIHVISHGSSGRVALGNLWLDTEGVVAHADTLAAIGRALRPGGDLLLYGCNVAAGDGGASFVRELARATGADVAASDDLTGLTALGGDWVLERQAGAIEARLFATDDVGYGGLLAAPTTETFNGVAVDGGGHSFGTPGQPRTINGWTFTMLGADGNPDTNVNSYIDVTNLSSETSLANDGADHAAALNGALVAGTGQAAAVLAATSGEEFAFQSIVVENYQSGGADYRLVGYRNGSAVSGATQDFTAGTYPNGGTLVTVSGSAWQNLDEVRIVRQGGQTDVSIYVDDITVSSAVTAAISSATYNASTGVLSVTGSGMTTGDTIDPTKLTVTGSNGGTYTLTSSSVTASSATAFSITLNAADKVAVNGLFNYDGTTAVNGTTYNLSAASGWDATANASADTTNGVTVSSVATPTITSATYDASTNVLVVTGTRLVGQPGAANDITVSNLRLRGEGGTTYTLTTGNVDVSSETSFSVTLNATDEAAVELLFNRNGTTSTDISTYTLSALDYWNTDVNDGGMADSNNIVTVSNVPVPAITSATYDASTGVLVVTGTGFTRRSGAANDIDLTKLTLSGEGGASHTLTTSDVDVTNGTSFSVTLNATDRAAVGLFMNRSGTSSTSGTTYNLAAAEDWARGAATAVTVADTTGNGVTATVPAPTITSATYDAATGTLVVTGTGFVNLSGAANDIDVSKLTLSGDSTAYALTSSNVDVTSSTSFTVTLNGTDVTALTTRLNQNGTSSVGANTYNLAAAEDWAAGAAAAVAVADTTGNGVTVSNFVVRPTVSVVVADGALSAGETSLVTFTFSEAVTGFTNADLTVSNGTLSAVASADGGTTWTATLTPNAGVSAPTNVVSVDMTGVTSQGTSNTGTGSTNSNNYAIDTARPTATLVVADGALAVGETSGVTITFSEAVTGFTNADLTVANGTLTAVSSSNGGVTWTATFTPSAGVTAGTNVITLDNTGVVDAAGNAGSGSTDSNNYAVDTVRPTATIVVADTALAAGETSGVTFTFSEAVTGFTNADLSIANGTLSAVSSIDGGITWTATLTPSASTTDTSNLITLDNTGVADAAGNAGSGSTDSNNYAIDTTRPTATITLADAALKVGDTSAVTITFSEAVTGFTNADLTVDNGTLTAVSSSNGGITWTATFTPSAGVTDGSNVITLDNTGVVDAAGNAGTGGTNSGNYTIDTARPTATVVVADAALAVGETSGVTITFSETVSGFTNADLTVASGTLSAVSSLDGGITWTATLTPSASTTDTSNLITLDNTGVTDAAGNAGTGSTDSNNYAIDTVRPTATIALSDAALLAGETALVTINFSEAVTGFTNADLSVPNGTLSAVSSSNGGSTWTATYTPNNAVLDASNVITLDNTGVTDAAGNTGTGSTDSANFTIDTTDNVAPVLATAVVDGRTLVLTYTDANLLNAANTAPLASFAVSGDGGVAYTVTGVAVDGAARTVTLTLDNAVLQGEGVTVRYTDPSGGNDAQATQDLAGNDAASFGPLSATNITGPDVSAPTASLSVADIDLTAGESTTVTISFSEPVADLTLADLTAGNGTLSSLQQVDARTWTVRLDPFVNANAGVNVVRLAAAGIHDRSGNPGSGSHDSNPYAVRSLSPAASITLDDHLLTQGESTRVTVRFGQAVTGLDVGDFSVQGGSLGAPSSSDGGLSWTATFTPAAGTSSTNNVILLNHAGIRTAGDQPGSGSTSSASYTVDTVAPSLTISADGGTVAAGEAAVLTLRFSEAPLGFGLEDIGVQGARLAGLTATADPRVYSVRYTPTESSNSLSVASGSYTDAAGNAGAGASFAGVVVDVSAPVFDPTGSSPADGSASVAVASTLVLRFNEPLSAAQSNLATVTLRRADGSPVAALVSIDASGALVIDPVADLPFDTNFVVSWDADTLKDRAGNAAAANSSYDFRSASAPTSGPGTQDGVPVDTVLTQNPDGSSTVTQGTPPVQPTRPEDPDTPNAGLADIVLAGDNGEAPLLRLGLPVGVGFRSENTSGGSLTLREQLVNAATGREPDAQALAQLITQGIDHFLPTVTDGTQVTVRTITFQQAGSGASGSPVLITGAQGHGEGSSAHPDRHEALVIDVSGLNPGTVLQLDNVEFALIVGAGRFVGGGGRNFVVGDGASQHIVLGAEDDQLRGGGGDDTIGSKDGNDTLYGDDGNDHLVGGAGNDTLEGGAGNDVLQGSPSDAGTWTFQLDPQGQLLSRFSTADADLGGPVSDTYIGAWTAPSLPVDSDDRLAYSYQDPGHLKDVAMLYRCATGALPSLNELNAISTSGLGSTELARLAIDHLAAHPTLPPTLAGRVAALIEAAWGPGSASDALVSAGIDYLGQGGSWADGLLTLARDARSLLRSTDAQGQLSLSLPLVTGELGWHGDTGHDVLRGGAGDDRLVGGRGSDLLDGGEGIDTAVFLGNVRDYRFHKTTVDGVVQLVMQAYAGGEVDTLVGIERWEIGSKTYAAADALARLPDNVDAALADFLVELVGQPAS